MDLWNPDLYATYSTERSQPFFDLVDLIEPSQHMRVIDLGCGDGKLTAAMHQRLSASETLGIDSSQAMLDKAPTSVGGLTFAHQNIDDWGDAPGSWDLVFSNAALQWVDDPNRAIEIAASGVGPGGQLAVQVPANHMSVSHRTAADVAASEPFASALQGWVRAAGVLTPREYAVQLHELGFSKQHVRLQVYTHSLQSRDDVADWVRGTLLLAYLTRLPDQLAVEFESTYRETLRERLPDDRPFFYPFERILMWGRRG